MSLKKSAPSPIKPKELVDKYTFHDLTGEESVKSYYAKFAERQQLKIVAEKIQAVLCERYNSKVKRMLTRLSAPCFKR